MNYPTSLTLEEVRCFSGARTGPIGRITVLIGDNGTGKSTFLGCYRAFAELTGFDGLRDRNYFDADPFRMGRFPDIARDGAGEFAVAGAFGGRCHESVRIAFGDGGREYPEERSISIRPANAPHPFRIERTCESREAWRLEGPGFRFELDAADVAWRQMTTWLSLQVCHGQLPFRGELTELRKQIPGISADRQNAFAALADYLTGLPFPTESARVVPLQPGPAERRRRYTTLPYAVDDGVLAERVAAIGREVGLFSQVGSSPPGPDGAREIRVRTPDGWRNLMDAGYGLHSVLALLFAICGHGDDTAFLLQQPEAHIHPGAQAALATVMAASRQRFLIETHSDYFVDRFRICVMEGDLEPEDLQILYFEKAPDGRGSTIHGIGVDRNGNLEGEPREFRRFFLEETNRLLGFGQLEREMA